MVGGEYNLVFVIEFKYEGGKVHFKQLLSLDTNSSIFGLKIVEGLVIVVSTSGNIFKFSAEESPGEMLELFKQIIKKEDPNYDKHPRKSKMGEVVGKPAQTMIFVDDETGVPQAYQWDNQWVLIGDVVDQHGNEYPGDEYFPYGFYDSVINVEL